MLDPLFYKAYYDDLRDLSDEEAISHWEHFGEREGRFSNPDDALRRLKETNNLPVNFDVETYVGLNKDVKANIRWPFEAVQHFVQHGKREFRHVEASTTFNAAAQSKQTQRLGSPSSRTTAAEPDLDASYAEPIFDAGFYRRYHYVAMRDTQIADPRQHYDRYGRQAGYPVSASALLRSFALPDGIDAAFSAASYLAAHPDIEPLVLHPGHALLHYVTYGRSEGRSASPVRVDWHFVKEFYGIRLPHSVLIDAVPAYMRQALGKTVLDPVFASEEEMAIYYGFRSDYFHILFDPNFYWAVSLDRSGPIPYRSVCMEHFLTFGRHIGLDISAAARFSDDFYLGQYADAVQRELTEASDLADGPIRVREDQPDLSRVATLGPAAAERVQRLLTAETSLGAGLSRLQLYRNWLSFGLDAGREPNLACWVRSTYQNHLPASIEQQLHVLSRSVAPETGRPKPSALIERLFEGRRDDLDCIVWSDARSADFLTAIADRLATSGDAGKADLIYGRVIAQWPHAAKALRHRAGLVQKLGLFGTAINLFRDARTMGVDDKQTFIDLSECHSRNGEFLAAGRVLNDAMALYAGDAAMARLAADAARVAFTSIWDRSVQTALTQGKDVAIARVRAALELFPASRGSRRPSKTVETVAIVGNEQLPQCTFYRIEQKCEQLEQAGIRVETFDYLTDVPRFLERLDRFDAVIFYRTPAFLQVMEAISKARAFGLPTFYDVDDMVFDTTQFPPDLETYAGQVTKADHASMACGVALFDHAMRMCDYGIASTPTIAAAMRLRVGSGRVFLHRNAMGLAHEAACRPTRRLGCERRHVSLFYGSGSKAHQSDFRDLIEPALIETVRRFGERVRIVLVGEVAPSPQLAGIRDQVDAVPAIDRIEDYWDFLSSEADINLSVLAPSAFNDGKSEIKWLEAAMFGIPSVVSDTATHREVIRHGATGFLCRSPEDFARAIAALVERPELRHAVGEAARIAAARDYGLAAGAANLRAIFDAVSPAETGHKPRILIVNVFYPPQAIGGATRVVHDNVSALRQIYGDHFHIDVACSLQDDAKPYALDWHAADGVRVFTIAAAPRVGLDHQVEDAAMAAPFKRILDIVEPDLVHFHCVQRLTTTVIDVVRRRRIPYLVTAHDGWWISDYQFLVDPAGAAEYYDFSRGFADPAGVPKRARACLRSLAGAERVLAVSEPFAEIYRRVGVVRVETIENGVSRLTEAHRVPSPSGRVRLGYVGGESRHKGYDLIRIALQANGFDNLELMVVEHALEPGESRDETWGTVPVRFVPKVPQDRVGELYGQIDILLAPSIWPESYGLVTREALACGCWVVASDRGAIGDCVTEGVNGFRIPVEDRAALVAVLRAIDAQPSRFLLSPPSIVNWRTADEQADQLARIYGEILGRAVDA